MHKHFIDNILEKQRRRQGDQRQQEDRQRDLRENAFQLQEFRNEPPQPKRLVFISQMPDALYQKAFAGEFGLVFVLFQKTELLRRMLFHPRGIGDSDFIAVLIVFQLFFRILLRGNGFRRPFLPKSADDGVMAVRLSCKTRKHRLVFFACFPRDSDAFRFQLMVCGYSRKFLQGKLFATDGMVMHQLPHVHVLLMVPSDEAQPVQPTMCYLQIRFLWRLLYLVLFLFLHICAFATAMRLH